MATALMQNYNAFLRMDLSSYEGRWVALFDGKVIASGMHPKEVYREATKISKKKKIMLTKVPKRGIIEIL